MYPDLIPYKEIPDYPPVDEEVQGVVKLIKNIIKN